MTLNPFYSHRAEIEALMAQPAGGGGEAVLDALMSEIGTAMAADRSLRGFAENLFWSALETSVLAIEGAAPILTASSTWSATRWSSPDPTNKGVAPMPKVRAYGATRRSGSAQRLSFARLQGNGICRPSRPLADDPLLGRGRNAQDPYHRLITDEGRSRSRSISGARASGSRACSVIRQRRKPGRRGTSRFLRSR